MLFHKFLNTARGLTTHTEPMHLAAELGSYFTHLDGNGFKCNCSQVNAANSFGIDLPDILWQDPKAELSSEAERLQWKCIRLNFFFIYFFFISE